MWTLGDGWLMFWGVQVKIIGSKQSSEFSDKSQTVLPNVFIDFLVWQVHVISCHYFAVSIKHGKLK